MATAIVVVVFAGGIAFMIRFFVALCQDKKTWTCFVVTLNRPCYRRQARILPFPPSGRTRASLRRELLLR